MKVIYLTNGNIGSKAAYVVHISSMCNALQELGHEVQLVTPHFDETFDTEAYFEKQNINHLFIVKQLRLLDIRFMRNISFFINSIFFLLTNRYDVVFIRSHIWMWYLPFVRNKMLLEQHSFPKAEGWQKKWEYSSYQSKKLKKIVLITDALKKIYVKEYPKVESKLHVAPDGANLHEHSIVDVKIEGTHTKNIGYIGHLYEGRGVDIIVELARTNYNIGYHLIGGHLSDVEKWKERSKGLSNIFFYGFQPHSSLFSFAAKLDVMLAPYQEVVKVKGGGDTSKIMSPLKIFEYMAYRRPFICSDIPVLKEVLKDGFNCLLSHPSNVEDWDRCIKRLLEDEELTKQLAESAYNDLKSNYTWKKRAEKIFKNL